MGIVTDFTTQHPWLAAAIVAGTAAAMMLVIAWLTRRGIIPRIPSHEEALRLETELGLDFRDRD